MIQVRCLKCNEIISDSQCGCGRWMMAPPTVSITATGRSSVDPGDVIDSGQRVIAHHCPACEAAARERDDLRARLEALAAEWSQNAHDAMLDGDNRAADETEWYAQKLRAELRKEAK